VEHAVCYTVVGNEWVCEVGNDQHDEWTYLIPQPSGFDPCHGTSHAAQDAPDHW
jgi:hypothetical protein